MQCLNEQQLVGGGGGGVTKSHINTHGSLAGKQICSQPHWRTGKQSRLWDSETAAHVKTYIMDTHTHTQKTHPHELASQKENMSVVQNL